MERERAEPGRGGALEERPIDIADVLLEDVVEVAHRLVQVHAENESQRLAHTGISARAIAR